MKKILITGGHLSPAIALIEELQTRGWEINVVGRGHSFDQAKQKPSLEITTLKELKIPFHLISAKRFPRNIFEISAFIISDSIVVFQMIGLLKKIKPTIVFSFGGYLSAPVLVACLILRIPYYIHDQTIVAGRANKLFSYFAKKVFVAWKETIQSLPQSVQPKTILTGNLVRKEILHPGKTPIDLPDTTLPLLYITGGSTGSHAINMCVAEALPRLLERYRIIHQCGDSHFNDYEVLNNHIKKLSLEVQKRYILKKYIPLAVIGATMKQADVIIGRAGASTVTEISILGKPALFIPLPISQYNEQEYLAQKLAQNGSAVIVQQEMLTPKRLVDTLDTMIKNKEVYYAKARTYSQSEEVTRHTLAGTDISRILTREYGSSGDVLSRSKTAESRS